MGVFWDNVQKMRKQSVSLVKSEKPVKQDALTDVKKKSKKQKSSVIKAVESDDTGTSSISQIVNCSD
jgi:hypothetical protein